MAINKQLRKEIYMSIQEISLRFVIQVIAVMKLLLNNLNEQRKRRCTNKSYSMIDKIPHQIRHLNRIVGVSDTDCIVNLRMNRNTFGRLCKLLRELGTVSDGKYVTVEEQTVMFLCTLAHHKKNRVIGFDFLRSGHTVSCYMHIVLKAILKLHDRLLVKPEPVTEDKTDGRWKWFKGCLGALDGTYINLSVPIMDKPRYRSRKGQICTNTLAVCDRKLRFVYVLPRWEGSAADSRVLRDAVNRYHGLKVPKGNYYLCDNGYANSEGFLAPYRGVRYHLKEWGPTCQIPQNAHENFNMRHAKARNIIERAFRIMKKRWGILRSASYYPVKVQNRLIMACFLLHNFIRCEMPEDPIEMEFDDSYVDQGDNEAPVVETDFIEGIENSNAWNTKRDSIAETMWTSFSEMDRVLLSVLTHHKEKRGWSSNKPPLVSVTMVELALKEKLGLTITSDEVYERMEFMENRYKTYKMVSYNKKAGWDSLGKRIVASPDIWAKLFRKNPLAQAYYHNDEPEFHKLAILFGKGDVKVEDAKTIITISDSTNDDRQKMMKQR